MTRQQALEFKLGLIQRTCKNLNDAGGENGRPIVQQHMLDIKYLYIATIIRSIPCQGFDSLTDVAGFTNGVLVIEI